MKDADELLGRYAQDTVTGFHGVITAVSEQYPGCTIINVERELDRPDMSTESMFKNRFRFDLGEQKIPPATDNLLEEKNITLGTRVRHTVSGFEGVVTIIQHDLESVTHVSVMLSPEDDDAAPPETKSVDLHLLERVDDGMEAEFEDLVDSDDDDGGERGPVNTSTPMASDKLTQ
ncbi:hypothetical protein [Halosegnis longus]|uniref:hypothetical protein n=1 Tax=Halosegnis longus TaxID=2216012 RepID=UPI00129ECC19|nr:hypothetical protein [Halosegnis longus]